MNSRPFLLSPDSFSILAGMGTDPTLSVTIAGVTFRNPVWVASGTFGYGLEFIDLIDVRRLGAIVVKGLAPQPMKGNPEPRLYETPAGMLNSVGLQNVGVDAFIEEKLPGLRTLGTSVIANVYGYCVEDYARVAARLNDCDGITALELNISCPNTARGGVEFAADPEATRGIVLEIKRVATHLPLIVKLSPNVGDIAASARAAEAGAPTRCRWSTPSWAWPSTWSGGGRSSAK